jgi:hypothetical protein
MIAAFGPTDEIVGKLNPLKCCHLYHITKKKKTILSIYLNEKQKQYHTKIKFREEIK